MRAVLLIAVFSGLLGACSTYGQNGHGPQPAQRSGVPTEDCLRPSGEEETDGGVGGTGHTLESCRDAGAGETR